MAVVPPPPPGLPSAARPGDLGPEDPDDARMDAGMHEGAADELLAQAVKNLGEGDPAPALARSGMASAEAALALGFRVGQLSAQWAQVTPTLERIAVALEQIAKHSARPSNVQHGPALPAEWLR